MLLLEAIYSNFEFNFRKQFTRALAKGLVGEAGLVRDFATRLNSEFGNLEDAAAEFSVIAQDAHAALLESYESTVEGRKVVPGYRGGAGRYPGALGQALKDPSMVFGDSHGISYINRPLLDLEAKHWRRLNFGTQGTRVSANVSNFYEPVRFDGRILFYAGSRAGLRPPFGLPQGFFVDPRTGTQVHHGAGFTSSYSGGPPTTDRFFPTGSRQLYMTGGIDPRHYIDAGFAVIAKDFGPALDRLYSKWIFDAQKAIANPRPLTVEG